MLFLKALLGAVIVILIDLIARSKKFYAVSGLVPLFPTFALISHVLVYSKQGEKAVKVTALMGLYSLLPYAVYLVSVYFLSSYLPFWLVLVLSVVFWSITAGIVVFLFYQT